MHWLSTAMLTESLKSWKQAHWRCKHLHTALRKTSHCSCWLHTVFCHWFCKFRLLHVLYRLWHWSTESMSRGSAKIHVLYPHHCALHDTVKHPDCLAQAGLKDLAQVTDKKADRVHTGLTWIAHCQLCRRKILKLFSLFVCLFVCLVGWLVGWLGGWVGGWVLLLLLLLLHIILKGDIYCCGVVPGFCGLRCFWFRHEQPWMRYWNVKKILYRYIHNMSCSNTGAVQTLSWSSTIWQHITRWWPMMRSQWHLCLVLGSLAQRHLQETNGDLAVWQVNSGNLCASGRCFGLMVTWWCFMLVKMNFLHVCFIVFDGWCICKHHHTKSFGFNIFTIKFGSICGGSTLLNETPVLQLCNCGGQTNCQAAGFLGVGVCWIGLWIFFPSCQPCRNFIWKLPPPKPPLNLPGTFLESFRKTPLTSLPNTSRKIPGTGTPKPEAEGSE